MVWVEPSGLLGWWDWFCAPGAVMMSGGSSGRTWLVDDAERVFFDRSDCELLDVSAVVRAKGE